MTHQHASSASAGNDPAASMSLLKAILENPLDAGYGTYHEKASRGVTSVFHRTITILIAIALGIGAGVCNQWFTRPSSRGCALISFEPCPESNAANHSNER